MAKASFSAYLLGNFLLKAGEKSTLFDQKKHDQLWSSFLFLPFSLFLPSKWPKCAVFTFQKQKGKKVGRKRGLRKRKYLIPSFSGFRKRGHRNGVASDSFRSLPFFHVFSFFSVPFFPFWLFFGRFRFFPFFIPFSSDFFPFSSVSFSEKKRHRSRNPFCETLSLVRSSGKRRKAQQL